jgi:hypothetical protein
VPISVGMRAGSHFNVPYRLEKYLPLDNIKTVNTGGFGARLRALLDGEVEAASLLPPQIAMAEQLGLRKIIEDTFKTLWWVPTSSPPEVVHGYMRALKRAEQALEANLPKYLPLWKLAVPAEFDNVHAWDFSKFGRGERYIDEPLPKEDFGDVFEQVQRWNLPDFLKEKRPEQLSYSASSSCSTRSISEVHSSQASTNAVTARSLRERPSSICAFQRPSIAVAIPKAPSGKLLADTPRCST